MVRAGFERLNALLVGDPEPTPYQLAKAAWEDAVRRRCTQDQKTTWQALKAARNAELSSWRFYRNEP